MKQEKKTKEDIKGNDYFLNFGSVTPWLNLVRNNIGKYMGLRNSQQANTNKLNSGKFMW